jgi:hypothetical protein
VYIGATILSFVGDLARVGVLIGDLLALD